MINGLLFTAVVLIWGCSWFAIKHQLGVVDPIISIFWRFFIASILAFGLAWWRGESLRLTRGQHTSVALQGVLLFCLNFIFLYYASFDISSGLVAVIFSIFTIFNIMFSHIFLGKKSPKTLWIGAVLGVFGIIIIFIPEFEVDFNEKIFWGIIYGIIGTISASLGNIMQVKNKNKNINVIVIMAFGMMYGALALAGLGIATGKEFIIDWHWPYIVSLLYLSVLAAVGTFFMYLSLINRIGPERAGYTAVLFPVVALFISFTIEKLPLHTEILYGAALALLGSFLVLYKPSKKGVKI